MDDVEPLYQVTVGRVITVHSSQASTVDRSFLRQHCKGITEEQMQKVKPIYLAPGDSVTINYQRAYTHLDLEVAMLLKLQYDGVLTVMPEPEPPKGVWEKLRSKFTDWKK